MGSIIEKNNDLRKWFLSKNKYFIFKAGIIQYYIAFTGIVLSPILTYCSYLQLSRRLFFFFLVVSLSAVLCCLIGKDYISLTIKTQMVCCNFIALLIFTPIFMRNILEKREQYYFYAWFELFVITIGFLFWTSLIEKRKYLKNLITWFTNHKIFSLLLVLVLAISFEQIDKGLRWDSIQYYSYIARTKEFTFSPNDIQLFKAAGHASYGYVLLYSIGEAILPGKGYGVRILSIIFFIISIITLYKILEEILPKSKRCWIDFSVAIYAVTPVILGPIHNIDVEILILTLYSLLFYCYIKRQYIVFMMLAVFFVFTKETCVLLLSSFLFYEIGKGVVYCIKKKEIICLIKRNLNKYLAIYLPLAIFVFYFAVDVTWGGAKASKAVDKFNSWGFNKIIIMEKLKQFYVMNFAWLTTLIIICGIIVYYYNMKKETHKSRKDVVILLSITYIIFLLIQTTYITYTFPRYIMLQYFFVPIALCWALNQIVLPLVIKKGVCVMTFILTLIQNFHSVDYISKQIYNTISIGNESMTVNSPIVYLNNTTVLTGNDAKFLYFSAYADMNRQWSYFDVLINCFLEKIDYKEGDLVLYPDTFNPRSGNVYFGMWSNIFYDRKAKRLQHVIDSSDSQNMDNMIKYEGKIITDEDILFEKYTNVYLLEFPFDSYSEKELVRKNNVLEEINVEFKGWSLKAYKIRNGE